MRLDAAIIAAAVGSRQSYTAVQQAVAEYEVGKRPLPGTLDHDAVVAWRAASHALEHVASHSTPSDGLTGDSFPEAKTSAFAAFSIGGGDG